MNFMNNVMKIVVAPACRQSRPPTLRREAGKLEWIGGEFDPEEFSLKEIN